MRLAVAVSVLVMSLWSLPSEAQPPSKKIQCWTDKAGARMCGDRIPPEYAGQKREVMKDGRVVETITANKSREELAEEKRKKDEAEATRKAAEYDRALLESYRTPTDIVTTRDERLALVDNRIQSAEKGASDTDKSLTGLRTRAEALAKDGKEPDERLNKQVRQFEKAQKQNTAGLERYRNERTALQAKFDKDFLRYNELRGFPPTPPPPPKAAASEAPAAKAAAPTAAPAAAPAPKAGG